MQHNSYRRWITLAIISFSGGVSFDLAYLRYIYQIPMAKFMGFSNTEIGLIMSTFGIAAIILYAPSGVIADKFSHRKMITSAMIITGLLGLIMATYPPLWVMLCIQVAFAITTILMLWSVSIKAASLLGDHSEQGKIMGTTVGICSVIGFLPDVFVYPIIGYWQDTLPAAEAYRNMWLMGMAALGMVIIFTFLLFQKIRTADSAPAMASSK
ncbi:TPA: MFS transporter [Escherichia coli]|nr:MFS transporter [Escherichia coli]